MKLKVKPVLSSTFTLIFLYIHFVYSISIQYRLFIDIYRYRYRYEIFKTTKIYLTKHYSQYAYKHIEASVWLNIFRLF